jgi:glycosyltransferase involved in cell wall biosynthesis
VSKAAGVAVVIPVWHTRADWLLASMESALRASSPETELIIVDDGNDPPLDPSRVFSILRIDHSGTGIARNAGNRATSADLICVQDADDIMLPDRIATQVRYLAAHPEVDVVSGQMDYIDPDGKLIGQPRHRPFVGPDYNGRVPHGASMYRRSLWERVGGYPEERRSGEDWRFFLRCEKAGCAFAVLPDVFIQRRIHPGSRSFSRSRHLQRWWKKAKNAR